MAQSMTMIGWLWTKRLARGSSVDFKVTSPGLKLGNDGSKFSSSFSQYSAFLMKPTCGPISEVMKYILSLRLS